jgi:TolB protein
VFQSGKPDITQGQVYVMNGDGSGVRRLTSPSTGPNILPAWSPKGSTIAFASARDGYPRIYVMDARGRDQRPLTAKGVIGISPAWAPDGKRLAFSCMRGGRVAICAATMPAGRLAAVWKAPANFGVLGLDWSPDGRRILFMGTRGQAPDIYAVGADGKGLRRLTTGPGERQLSRLVAGRAPHRLRVQPQRRHRAVRDERRRQQPDTADHQGRPRRGA